MNTVLKMLAVGLLWGLVAGSRADVVQTHFQAEGTGPRIVVVSNYQLYDQVAVSLRGFAADLMDEGYAVTIVKLLPATTAQQFRDYLKTVAGIKGALFVGSLPSVQFRYGTGEGASGPCDYYYMDLDGTWEDTDGDRVLDLHTPGGADRACEIWVSRLTPTGYSLIDNWSEADYINNYFTKNHAYRRGLFRSAIAHRALVYPDDHAASSSERGVEKVYGDVEVIYEPALTTMDDFVNKRLTTGYELVHLVAHSSENFSMLYRGTANHYNKFYSEDIARIDPKSCFFILEACANANHRATNYMAGYYILGKSYGLAAIGLTRNSATALVHNFYEKLSPNSRWSLGEAYRYWMNHVVFNGVAYALTLLGDGTLGIDPPVATIVSIATDKTGIALQGRGSVRVGRIEQHRWSSSIQGLLGTDSILSAIQLSKGHHVLAYQVKDSCGRWSTASLDSMTIKEEFTPTNKPSNLGVRPMTESSAQVKLLTLSGRVCTPMRVWLPRAATKGRRELFLSTDGVRARGVFVVEKEAHP